MIGTTREDILENESICYDGDGKATDLTDHYSEEGATHSSDISSPELVSYPNSNILEESSTSQIFVVEPSSDGDHDHHVKYILLYFSIALAVSEPRLREKLIECQWH